MSTTDPSAACPALHVLNGTMGPGRWPEHAPDERGRCVHCRTTVDRFGDRSGLAANRTRNPWR